MTPVSPRAPKRAAAARGRAAEQAAAEFAAAQGWTVVERNLRVGGGELDLVALDGESVVVVEVRTRSAGAFCSALESVDARKIARVRRAGEALWRTRFERDPSVERMRFDVAAVSFEGGATAIEWVRAAF